MLTINELVREIKTAKRKGVESVFLSAFFESILEQASNQKSSGYILFDAFKNIEEYSFFVKTVQSISEENYNVKNLVTDIDVNAEDYELEVHFDLNKDSNL
tara:strand:- start:39480 stop:39782 length:303 start_codon:yes stop_codon:yes gene_type:complete